jgi:hypothetical protein
MNTEIEKLIPAITIFTSIGGVIVSIIAAWSANKSASASKSSAEVAQKIYNRSVIRELITCCQSLIVEDLLIQSLVADLKIEFTSLATFSGALGGSRQTTYIERFNENLKKSSNYVKDAKHYTKELQKLILASESDIDRIQGEIEFKKTELQAIRESMERTLNSVHMQTLQYREKQLNKK